MLTLRDGAYNNFNKAGDNPAYALSGCNERQGEREGEHKYVQSPPAAPEDPVYEHVFRNTLERSCMH